MRRITSALVFFAVCLLSHAQAGTDCEAQEASAKLAKKAANTIKSIRVVQLEDSSQILIAVEKDGISMRIMAPIKADLGIIFYVQDSRPWGLNEGDLVKYIIVKKEIKCDYLNQCLPILTISQPPVEVQIGPECSVDSEDFNLKYAAGLESSLNATKVKLIDGAFDISEDFSSMIKQLQPSDLEAAPRY